MRPIHSLSKLAFSKLGTCPVGSILSYYPSIVSSFVQQSIISVAPFICHPIICSHTNKALGATKDFMLYNTNRMRSTPPYPIIVMGRCPKREHLNTRNHQQYLSSHQITRAGPRRTGWNGSTSKARSPSAKDYTWRTANARVGSESSCYGAKDSELEAVSP